MKQDNPTQDGSDDMGIENMTDEELFQKIATPDSRRIDADEVVKCWNRGDRVYGYLTDPGCIHKPLRTADLSAYRVLWVTSDSISIGRK